MRASDKLAARIAGSIALAVSTLILVVSFAVSPEQIESGSVRLTPPCPYRLATGEPCLGCGMSRAFAAISHGRLADGRRYNPLSPWLYAATWLVGVGSLALIALTFRRRSVSVSLRTPARREGSR